MLSINRGGEIISPMEVEEGVLSHPDVEACAAFSASHEVLQEVVGIVLVMAPGRPRLDLASLHEHLGDRLAAPKWPQTIVFMDGLPKSHTNKLLRVRLGNRLGLPKMNDDMLLIERTFEAKCPPQGTGLDVAISASPVCVWAEDVEAKLKAKLLKRKSQQLLVVAHPIRTRHFVCYVHNLDRVKTIGVAQKILDRYAVPTYFVSLEHEIEDGLELSFPEVADTVTSILNGAESTESHDPLVRAVQKIFVDTLSLDAVPGPNMNFFRLGGSSMLASQLASQIRKSFEVACSGANVFQYPTCKAIAKMVREQNQNLAASPPEKNGIAATPGPRSSVEGSLTQTPRYPNIPFPSNRLKPKNSFLTWAFQMVPMFLLFPIWQVTRYMLFFVLLLWSLTTLPSGRDIGTFVTSYLLFYITWHTVAPLVFVAIKWIVIGRYKEGRYAIWSGYYFRWWFVDICRKLFLRGIWLSNDAMLNFYYRLLGAKVGAGARINRECEIAEFDLVTVGKDAAVESATLRGFGVDNGAMILGPVQVGEDASLGTRSVVAPYTIVPDGGHVGPVACTYDTSRALESAHHARVNRQNLPQPNAFMNLFVAGPIVLFVNAVSYIPPLAVLMWMLEYKGQQGEEFSSLGDLMEWLCEPQRIPFFIAIRVARAIVSPFMYIGAAVAVKRGLIGEFKAGPRSTSQWQLTRHFLVATLLSRKKIQDVTDLIGRHYELVSVLYRLLGAKVGKRVFWPGRQPVFSGEFDLLEVGDDVVFGSRSSIFLSTVDACKKVTLCAGANVADNCVVLPGSIVGKNTVLGSNSVCPEGWYLPEESVWFGSESSEPTCLEKGKNDSTAPLRASAIKRDGLQLVGDDSTLRPFGKAFYQRKASYCVWPLWFIVLISFLIKVFTVAFHTLPLLAAIHAAAAYMYGMSFAERNYDETQYAWPEVYVAVLFMFVGTNFVRVALSLAIELAAKWTILGRRRVGVYNYDTSSYAQRWELCKYNLVLQAYMMLRMFFFRSHPPICLF